MVKPTKKNKRIRRVKKEVSTSKEVEKGRQTFRD